MENVKKFRLTEGYCGRFTQFLFDTGFFEGLDSKCFLDRFIVAILLNNARMLVERRKTSNRKNYQFTQFLFSEGFFQGVDVACFLERWIAAILLNNARMLVERRAQRKEIYQVILKTIQDVIQHREQRVFPHLIRDFLPFVVSEHTLRRDMAAMAKLDMLSRPSFKSGYRIPLS